MLRKDGSLTLQEEKKKARAKNPPVLLDGRKLDEKMRKPKKHISYGDCPQCGQRMPTHLIREHCLMKHPLLDMAGNEIDPVYRKQATPADALPIQKDKRLEYQKEAKK